MHTLSSCDLAERLAGLERTVKRLMSDYLQLQRQVRQTPRINHGKPDGGLSIWKRIAFRRWGNSPSNPAIRENKRIHSHVVH